MNIGIVGAGQDKFVPETEARARSLIRQLLADPDAVLVSGHSPVGGIDIWAEEIADELGREKHIYAPKVDQWNPPGQYGYKARNLDIAEDSDVVHVIVVKDYPPGYMGQRFELCYHCARTRPEHAKDHKKSGGCYTAIKAMEMPQTDGRPRRQAVWHVL